MRYYNIYLDGLLAFTAARGETLKPNMKRIPTLDVEMWRLRTIGINGSGITTAAMSMKVLIEADTPCITGFLQCVAFR